MAEVTSLSVTVRVFPIIGLDVDFQVPFFPLSPVANPSRPNSKVRDICDPSTTRKGSKVPLSKGDTHTSGRFPLLPRAIQCLGYRYSE